MSPNVFFLAACHGRQYDKEETLIPSGRVLFSIRDGQQVSGDWRWSAAAFIQSNFRAEKTEKITN